MPPAARDLLRPGLETVALTPGQVLHRAGSPISHLFFPLGGVCSLSVPVGDGALSEFCIVGSEGLVGMPAFWRSPRSPWQAEVLVAGEAERLPVEQFENAVEASPSLRELLLRYTAALFTQVAQSVACLRLHTTEQRCARCLLTTQDQVGDSFRLTQRVLARVLGVRRATITVTAGLLQRAGLIRYARGSITILDRPGLELAACECHRVISRRFEQLVGA